MKKLIIFFLFALTSLALCSCADPINHSSTSDNAGQNGTSYESHSASTIHAADTILPVKNFVVYSEVGDKINEAFLKENRTYGAFYGDVLNDDHICPKTRIWTIQSQSDFDKIFDQEIDQTPLNYDQQMYVLYTFTTVYHRPFRINTVQNSEKGLVIDYTLAEPDATDEPIIDAARPFQYFVLIKTDKIDVKNIVFYES